ncbi:hypothetical protein [Tropicimonas marinistellae]|uniref:hypothetical protein n=1 Tax=Tropicimonas marinistellae TaxID=1739787 RepID=UPI000834DE8D|nr:hypothetical protein [Tropicimonas marinistellae]
MRCFSRIGAVLLLAASVALPASAQNWSSTIAEDGDGVSGEIAVDGKTFILGCTRQAGSSLTVLLTNGPHDGMQNADGEAETVTMRITLDNGSAGDFQIDGFYLEPEATFVGRLVASNNTLQQFARGMDLQLLTADGDLVLGAPMTGTGKIRGEMQDACGL